LKPLSGSVRLHAVKIFTGHIPVKDLLHLFEEDLSKLVILKGNRGVTVEATTLTCTRIDCYLRREWTVK
jgi:hypothetical protein